VDWRDSDDPFARQLTGLSEPESAAASEALRDYAEMGVNRSLRSLHRLYTEQAANHKKRRDGKPLAMKPPTSSLQTLYTWSVEFEWQARVKRWEAIQRQRDQDAYEVDRREWRKRRMDTAKAALGVTGAALALLQEHKMKPREIVDVDGKKHVYPPAILDELKLPGVIHALEEATALLRKEFGDDVQQIDLTLRQLDYSEFTDDELQRIRDGENPLRILGESRLRRDRTTKEADDPDAKSNDVSGLAEDASP